MTRSSILCGLFGIIGVAVIGATPLACQSGGVGDPCTPEDEYDPDFPGFKLTLENIESRSFQCETRLCLVNHFQGRVSCPLGQPPSVDCTAENNGSVGADDSKCSGSTCTQTAPIAVDCDPTVKDSCPAHANGDPGVCNQAGKFCECEEGEVAGDDDHWLCDSAHSKQFLRFICHVTNSCQIAGATTKDNCTSDSTPKDCCIPGTDQPVVSEVCGQCSASSNRNADQAVYCSCRCGVATGQPMDPNFNFCTCPTGFECDEIRPAVGLGDPELTGKYCIKTNTEYDAEMSASSCQVGGHLSTTNCAGHADASEGCGI